MTAPGSLARLGAHCIATLLLYVTHIVRPSNTLSEFHIMSRPRAMSRRNLLARCSILCLQAPANSQVHLATTIGFPALRIHAVYVPGGRGWGRSSWRAPAAQSRATGWPGEEGKGYRSTENGTQASRFGSQCVVLWRRVAAGRKRSGEMAVGEQAPRDEGLPDEGWCEGHDPLRRLPWDSVAPSNERSIMSRPRPPGEARNTRLGYCLVGAVCSTVWQMVAELRRIGSRLALYTDDNTVYERLSRWKATLYGVPYQQGRRIVAVDLYFEPWARKTVKRALRGQLMLNM